MTNNFEIINGRIVKNGEVIGSGRERFDRDKRTADTLSDLPATIRGGNRESNISRVLTTRDGQAILNDGQVADEMFREAMEIA